MPDREKVKKGLHQHCEGSMFDRCGECPYYEVADEPFKCRDAILMDVLALLKEQEPVKPYAQGDDSFGCGNCGETVGWDEMECYGIGKIRYKYCPECGRKVEWRFCLSDSRTALIKAVKWDA